MTEKRMIDADALLELIKTSLQAYENEYCQWTIERVIEKINELVTPAPEPQESILDAEGWCWDLSLAPKNTVVVYLFPDRNQPIGFPPIGVAINSDSIDSKNTNAKAWRPMPNTPKEI